jgi:hypothetical protein
LSTLVEHLGSLTKFAATSPHEGSNAMWDLQRELWRAQDEASRLGHKLRSFEPALNSEGGASEWKAVCERCQRVCTVARSADNSTVSRTGDVWAGPCLIALKGPGRIRVNLK